MSTQHISREFGNAIDSLKAEVLTMATLTRQNLERAMRSLLHRDLDLACTVIADDADMGDVKRQINQAGMEILVRFHPVASDLRLTITSMKMVYNLEQIAAHAVNIARRSKKICKSSSLLEEVALTEPLYSLADKLLRDAVMAYTDANAILGEGLKPRDKELNRLHKQVIAALSIRLENSHERAENLLHLILATRSIERIGDLAVNIGEDAVFLSEGRDIRHGHHNQPAPDAQHS